ncbi:hypothetical protein NDU88_003634 [Pleurodeles waltl]|uniref:Uncharacterized protein n=1 Tax=Pleurodeles waltl TaxID=8319 RepID=A0AAV7MR57_PLEWA|nr:hypothetical protein NDU88_003634 [Pleurodeles waltl]
MPHFPAKLLAAQVHVSRQHSLPGTPTGRVGMSVDSGVVTGSPRGLPFGLRAGTWAMPSSGVAASRIETSGKKAVVRGLDAATLRWRRHQLSLQEEQVPATICQATPRGKWDCREKTDRFLQHFCQ